MTEIEEGNRETPVVYSPELPDQLKNPKGKSLSESDWYKELPNGFSLAEDVEGKVFAALDVDGTLVHSYLMERFVQFLSEHKKFRELIGSMQGKKTDKEEEMEELLGMFKAARNMKEFHPEEDPYDQFRGYELFIKRTGDLYSKLLQNLFQKDILEFAEDFFDEGLTDEDKQNGKLFGSLVEEFGHTIEWIKTLQQCGIVVTLITGAPRELIEVLRKRLGLKEICYALEQKIDSEGRCKGEYKYNTGLPGTKEYIMRLLCEAKKHLAFLAAGDSIPSDGNLFSPTLNLSHPKDIHGGAIFIAESERAHNKATEVYAKHTKGDMMELVRRDQKSAERVVEILRELLVRVCLDERNQDEENEYQRIPLEIKSLILELEREKEAAKVEVRERIRKAAEGATGQLDLFMHYAPLGTQSKKPQGTTVQKSFAEPPVESLPAKEASYHEPPAFADEAGNPNMGVINEDEITTEIEREITTGAVKDADPDPQSPELDSGSEEEEDGTSSNAESETGDIDDPETT